MNSAATFTPTSASVHHRVAIIGAGFSGLGLLHRLRQRGITDVVVLEAADRPGGTWRDNTCPGCQCDVPSNLYSLSFAQNPSWSTTFPRLTPTYELGCKRVLLSNRYYRTLARPNVDVIDRAVEAATATGLVDADGTERPADVVVFATGFQVSGRSAYAAVRGVGGRRLDQVFDREGAYLGTAAAGFPNLFCLGGPATGAAYTSFLFMLESQQAYVVDAVATMADRRWPVVEVRRDAHARYVDGVQAETVGKVWLSGCRSWFLDDRGRNVAVWPGSSWSFHRRTRRFDPDAYEARARTAVTHG